MKQSENEPKQLAYFNNIDDSRILVTMKFIFKITYNISIVPFIII